MAFGSAANSGHVDANQQFSLTGVAGTLGTADTGGTALTVPLAGDPVTGALYVNNIGAAGNLTLNTGTITTIVAGTQSTLGTVGVVNNVVTGTLAAVTTVSNLTNGSVNILTGTLQSSGTTTGVGVVSNLTNGSINILTGTTTLVSTVTTLSNLTNGSVNILTGTLQSSGTTTGVGVVTALTNGSVNILTGTLQSSGTTTGVGVVTALTNGSVNVLTGTVTSVTNLAGGTTQQNFTPVNIGTPFNAIGTTGAAVWGTLVASSGNGIKQYVSGCYIVVETGTVEVAVTNIGIGGSTGAGVLARGFFGPGGGIQRTFFPNMASGTGGTLAYWLGGAGTVSVGVDYWQGA